ncbi:hypothetical protein D3C80_2099530 [compost metagenome]
MLAVFDHHFGKQFQANGKGRTVVLAKVQVFTRFDALNDSKNVVVVFYFKTQWRFLYRLTFAIA